MNKNKIVGRCKLCDGPIYAFQLVKNEMHEGCSKLKWNPISKEWE